MGVADEEADGGRDETRVPEQRGGAPELRLVEQRTAPVDEALPADDAGATALLDVVGRLVDRAREAGELRADVTVSDDAAGHRDGGALAAGRRAPGGGIGPALDILLEGAAVPARVTARQGDDG